MDTVVVLRAILYRLREGSSWRSLSIFGPWETIYGHWRRWVKMDIFTECLTEFANQASGTLWSIDSTSCKVHKHGHGGAEGPESQDIGTSKGGPNTKIHALVDNKRRIVHLFLSPGNRHDSLFAPLLVDQAPEGISILADKAYDVDGFRDYLETRGLRCCIPPKSNRKDPQPYSKRDYRKRHRVENAFQRLKEYRAIATRYEKLSVTFKALATLAALLEWI